MLFRITIKLCAYKRILCLDFGSSVMYEHFCAVPEGGDLKGRKMCLIHVFRGTFWSMAGGSIAFVPETREMLWNMWRRWLPSS